MEKNCPSWLATLTTSDANFISRPYNGEKLSFMTVHFNQSLGTINRRVGLSNCSFREMKCTGKYEKFFGKYEGFTFPSEEIPSIVEFTGKKMVHTGYKMGIVTSNKLMKSDETKAYFGEFAAHLCSKILTSMDFWLARILITPIKWHICRFFPVTIDKKRSGFGALAAGIGRVALPLARRFNLPTAKIIGLDLLKQGVPELVDVVSEKK